MTPVTISVGVHLDPIGEQFEPELLILRPHGCDPVVSLRMTGLVGVDFFMTGAQVQVLAQACLKFEREYMCDRDDCRGIAVGACDVVTEYEDRERGIEKQICGVKFCKEHSSGGERPMCLDCHKQAKEAGYDV